MTRQFSVKFFIRTDQELLGGRLPIYARVVLYRDKFDFSTGQYLTDLSEWDETTERVRKKTPINGVLNEIEHEVQEAYNFLKYHNRPLTVDALRTRLKGEKTDRLKFIDFIDNYYESYVVTNADISYTTKQTYKSTINHLKNYLTLANKNRMLLVEADINFIRDFDNYLVGYESEDKKALNKNTSSKYHINLKAMLYKACDRLLITQNPYKEFKLKSEPARLTYLTASELKKLEDHNLCGSKSLHKVRDIFLFSVYTGLRYSDAISLTSDNIEIDGNDYWIVYTQQKTGEFNRIPMLHRAIEIYNKYEENRIETGFIIPRMSNQKINAYLKTIADLVGIKKHLSHHTARHTAATTIFMQNGISLETTGKLLGHRSIKSTQIYAKITNFMLKDAADKLNKVL